MNYYLQTTLIGREFLAYEQAGILIDDGDV